MVNAVRPNDYWAVGTKRFESLEAVGNAVKDGTLSLAQDGNDVAHFGIDTAEAARLGRAARIGTGVTLAGAALTFGLAALAPAVPGGAVVLPLLGTMISASTTLGLWKAARSVETEPQVLESGRLSIGVDGGKPALAYQQDGPTQGPPRVLNTFFHSLSSLAELEARSKNSPGRRGDDGPDSTEDPDNPRQPEPGPDDVHDPDSGGRRGGDEYSGPDGTYPYDPYH